MSGVKVIRYLLANDSSLTTEVPAGRIMAGGVPIDTALPAISIELVSSVVRLTLAMNESPRMIIERVQVTGLVRGPSHNPAGDGYPSLKTIMGLVLNAVPNQRGDVNSVSVDSILPENEGPDLEDAATGIYSCSRDFTVRWLKT